MTVDVQTREAAAAGLRYVTDDRPGIRRERSGDGFAYVGPDGHQVDDQAELRRFKSLAIPPAWSDVWICPDVDGHLQATGRDARGRKQYRYHPRWRAHRDEAKFDRMRAFGLALPQIRARVAKDLQRRGMPREKVLALVVQLLEVTLIRIGNEDYARENGSFGLTTLTDEHLVVAGGGAAFEFRGKSGKDHRISLADRQLARLVKRCQDLPGQQLFQYLDDDGRVRDVESGDVNAYLQEIAGADFTAKDFRTWAGTLLVARELVQLPWRTKKQAAANVAAAIKAAASRLGNTPAVCRRSYVYPGVIGGYLGGGLAADWTADGETALLRLLAE